MEAAPDVILHRVHEEKKKGASLSPEKVKSDTEKYLANGGDIKQIPTGMTGYKGFTEKAKDRKAKK